MEQAASLALVAAAIWIATDALCRFPVFRCRPAQLTKVIRSAKKGKK